MLDAVMAELPRVDILVMCAAVADFRPAQTFRTKRSDERLTVELVRTPDILAAVSNARHHALVVGFSLDDSLVRAREKLHAKRLDMVVANPLTTPGAQVIRPRLLYRRGRTRVLPAMTKSEFARRLVAEIGRARRWHARKAEAGR
jgi:phosphopantothenoylcysteine decarboxylase/phosphopantothenate--cysteine ligase